MQLRDAVTAFVVIAGAAFAGCDSSSVTEQTPPGEDEPDFSISVNPLAQAMEPDDTIHFNVDIGFLDGFSSTNIDLWVSGLPAGVTATFVPDPLPHQGRSVMSLVGDGSTPASSYTLTVGADAEGIRHSLEIILDVTTDPDFTLAISPASQNVAAGGSTAYELTLSALNGFSDPVALEVSGLPAGTSAQVSPDPVVPPAISTLTVSTSQSTPLGTSDLTITATGGGITRSIGASLNVTSTGATWTIGAVGATNARNNTVRVGPLRNDGTDRVYVGTVTTGRVFEFSWDGNAWSGPVDIGGSPAGAEIHNMGMGPGRNDGITRLYAGSLDGSLYEISYTGSSWTQSTVGTQSASVFHAIVGDGRGDGTNRVYGARGNAVWEYTWTGSGWGEVQVGTVTSNAHGLALGAGRGDGRVRLYLATTGAGVFEATFSNGSWSMEGVADVGDTRNVGVGAGRDDGIARVYTARANGVMSELSWTGSGWSASDMNSSVGAVLIHAYVVDGRNDGARRVYSSAGNGNAYEFAWNGSGWTLTVLGGGSDYLYGFHFGRASGDGSIRMYGASFNTRVYEYAWQ